MSKSKKNVWQNEGTDRRGEFTYTWSIHNYSYYTAKSVYSPRFIIDEFSGDNKWWLQLYPKGHKAPGFLTCYLNGYDCYFKRCDSATFHFTFSIRKSNGQFKESGVNEYNRASYCYGPSKIISLEELKGPDSFLFDDTLTIRVRIWKTDAVFAESVNYDVHSRVNVRKLDYTWIVKGITVSNHSSKCTICETNNIRDYFEEEDISIEIYEGLLGEGIISFGIELSNAKCYNYFCISVVHLIDANGRVAHSARGEHMYEFLDETLFWNFPLISKDKLYANQDLYLPKGVLTLQCELAFAIECEPETFVFRITKGIESPTSTTDPDVPVDVQWIENMKKCCTDSKFSDFFLCTPRRLFPVRREILAAHCTEFRAIFETAMKKRLKTFAIQGLDEDTVSKMLMYVYSGTFVDIDPISAQKLYVAAVMFGIPTLLQKCSDYLMKCLDDSNVCDILQLADQHGDQDLKACARDFIHSHAQQIIKSQSWRKLSDVNSSLTSETMELMICKQF